MTRALTTFLLIACALLVGCPADEATKAANEERAAAKAAELEYKAKLDLLSIEAMRARSYPGSDFLIEKTLAEKPSYKQYIASYQSEGLKIYGLLSIPKGKGPFPAVLFLHGYIPPKEYRTTERYVAYFDDIAKSGYIVFKPDYRGHGSSGGDPSAGFREYIYTLDALNALGAMNRMKEIDSERIGVWGHSMGGLVGLRAVVVTKAFKAAVFWAGVTPTYEDILSADIWTSRHVYTPGYILMQQRDIRINVPSLLNDKEYWDSLTPNRFLNEIHTAMQLQHTELDHEVPIEYSEALDKAMKAAGNVSELYSYPGDDHNITKDYKTAMSRTLAFFEKYLKK